MYVSDIAPVFKDSLVLEWDAVDIDKGPRRSSPPSFDEWFESTLLKPPYVCHY